MIQFRLSILRFITILFFGALGLTQAKAQITCNFTATQDSGCAPVAIVLNDASLSPNSPITSRNWTITGPNGNLPIGLSFSYAYIFNECGNYSVSLTVTNAAGQTCTKTVANAIVVLCKPLANFSFSPKAGCPPTTVTFQNLTNPEVALWTLSFVTVEMELCKKWLEVHLALLVHMGVSETTYPPVMSLTHLVVLMIPHFTMIRLKLSLRPQSIPLALPKLVAVLRLHLLIFQLPHQQQRT